MVNYDYLYKKEYYDDIISKNHFSDKELSWSVYQNVTLIPFKDLGDNIGGGLLDSSGDYIDGSGIHKGMCWAYDYDETEVKYKDETIVFLGLWPDVWGHCLTDNLRRLWVLNDTDFMAKYGYLKFVYIIFNHKNLSDNFRSLLEILGIDSVNLEGMDELVRYRNVVIPDECFFRVDDDKEHIKEDGTRIYTKEYKALIDSIKKYGEENFHKEDYEKIYFTRRKFSLYRDIGERKIELFFKKLGYKIVSPEEYSFVEQLNMLLNCKEFASTVGSASHNSLFLRDDAKVYLITRANYIAEYQLAIDQLCDFETTYIDSTLSLYVHPKHPWSGPFYYIVSDNLKRCFGQDYRYKFNSLKFRIYKNVAFRLNEVTSPNDYYAGIYERYLTGDPEIHIKKNLFYKLCVKLKIQKILSMITNWLEGFER